MYTYLCLVNLGQVSAANVVYLDSNLVGNLNINCRFLTESQILSYVWIQNWISNADL